MPRPIPYNDAVSYTIRLPSADLDVLHQARTPVGGLREVRIDSPARLRRAVYTLARYGSRECGWGGPPYGFEGRETDPRATAFLWEHFGILGGACCFRWRRYTDAPPEWALQWVWLHPYWRGCGLLAEAWPYFRERFGAFVVEGPISSGMRAFLAKHDPEATVIG